LKSIVKKALDLVFVHAKNCVGHDLDAAAFALFYGEPLVACILGTGSNSCYFDGGKVREELPSLAYVLGDEGSASYIGKKLVSDFLYKRMPEELYNDFKKNFKLDKNKIFDAVYNKPNANVFLGSFGPFAGKHAQHPYVREIILEGFLKFIHIHVACFPEAKDVQISFVGAVA